jgi:hypothetical protein
VVDDEGIDSLESRLIAVELLRCGSLPQRRALAVIDRVSPSGFSVLEVLKLHF